MKKLLTILLAGAGINAFGDTNNIGFQTMTTHSVATLDNTQNQIQKNTNSTSIKESGSPYLGSNSFGDKNIGAYGELEGGSANSSSLNAGVNAALALRFDVGMKINSYLGYEGGMTLITAPAVGNQTAPLQAYDMSIKGYLPITNKFDLHGQFGLAYTNLGTVRDSAGGGTVVDSDNAGIKALIGAGMDIYITKSFAFIVNDYNYLGDMQEGGGNTNVIMGGLKYDFE